MTLFVLLLVIVVGNCPTRVYSKHCIHFPFTLLQPRTKYLDTSLIIYVGKYRKNTDHCVGNASHHERYIYFRTSPHPTHPCICTLHRSYKLIICESMDSSLSRNAIVYPGINHHSSNYQQKQTTQDLYTEHFFQVMKMNINTNQSITFYSLLQIYTLLMHFDILICI